MQAYPSPCFVSWQTLRCQLIRADGVNDTGLTIHPPEPWDTEFPHRVSILTRQEALAGSTIQILIAYSNLMSKESNFVCDEISSPPI